METNRIRQLLGAALVAVSSAPQAAELQPGDSAPSFELLDQHGKLHRLSDYRGQWLVVYFYPRDDTPGCTTEACEFRDDVVILKRMGIALLGVSTDDVKSHHKFAGKYHLPFALLSDARGEVARRYGSLMSMGPLKFAKRHTVIIDPDGRIARIYRKVRPGEHSDRVIADLEQLRAAQTQQDSRS
jgi:peroxiredoxin Q/BCP